MDRNQKVWKMICESCIVTDVDEYWNLSDLVTFFT